MRRRFIVFVWQLTETVGEGRVLTHNKGPQWQTKGIVLHYSVAA